MVFEMKMATRRWSDDDQSSDLPRLPSAWLRPGRAMPEEQKTAEAKTEGQETKKVKVKEQKLEVPRHSHTTPVGSKPTHP